MPRHLPLLATLALLVASPVLGQQRPAIPEVRCAEVRLELVPRTDGQRGMGLRIVNVDPGDFDAHLHREVHVEREVNGRWEPVHTAGLYLRTSCGGRDPSDPVTIPRDASLTIAPWSGMAGDAQCVCTRCAPVPAGRYRFHVVAWDCFQPLVTYSDPFTLPPA